MYHNSSDVDQGLKGVYITYALFPKFENIKTLRLQTCGPIKMLIPSFYTGKIIFASIPPVKTMRLTKRYILESLSSNLALILH